MASFETLFEKYKKAVFDKDLKAYTAIFGEDVRVFDMWQQWSYDGLVLWTEMAKGWFDNLGENRDKVDFSEVQINETAELAVATAIVRFTAVTAQNEELRFLENRLTWVAKKTGEEWKIIHQHTSGPIDFETMKVKLKR